MKFSVVKLGSLRTNCYIISDDNNRALAVIDPAVYDDNLKDELKKYGPIRIHSSYSWTLRPYRRSL